MTGCESAFAQNTIYLLGEVHDNPDVHAKRFAFIEDLLAKGFRPVIAMEQFDRDKQGALSSALLSCRDADCVIQKAGGRGWTWDFYKPVIQTALKYRLKIVAANLSSVETMKVVREGLSAVIGSEVLREYKADLPLDARVYEKHQEAIDVGHCHALPASAFKGMVNAQIARDVWMAKTIRENATHGLILLAGNGHVRKDIGSYYWLSSAEQTRSQVFAFTEQDNDTKDPLLFDQNVQVKPFDRADPCEVFKAKT